MRGITVFVSSVMSETEFEREITRQALEEMKLSPRIFEIFPAMSGSPMRACLDEVRECDIFILIVWKEITDPVVKEYEEAVTSGKPVLIFVRDLRDSERREPKLLTFLDQVKKSSKLSTYKNYRSLNVLRESIKEAVTTEIAQFYKTPITTITKEDMYLLGAEITNYAHKRLLIVEKTPSLFLEPRPYGHPMDQKKLYERKLYDSLTEWIAGAESDETKELRYYWFLRETRDEIHRFDLQQRARGNMKKYFEIEQRSGGRIRFPCVQLHHSGPVAIGDDWFAIWIAGEAEEAICISQRNKPIADALAVSLKNAILVARTLDELYAELGM